MANDRAFLDDIIEHPDDNDPRLIYADWLEEQGGDINKRRAEFIRADIAREQAKIYSPEWQRAMIDRNLALRPDGTLGEHIDRWGYAGERWFYDGEERDLKKLLGIPQLARDNSCVYVERGFIEGLNLQGKKRSDYSNYEGKILSDNDIKSFFDNAPIRSLYSVNLRETDDLKRLLEQDFFRRIEKFEGIGKYPSYINGTSLSLIAHSPNSSGLEYISLFGVAGERDNSFMQGIIDLCNSKHFELKGLNLGSLVQVRNRGNAASLDLSLEIARIVADSERMKGLESLEFSTDGSRLNSEMFPVLALSPNLGNLKKFGIGAIEHRLDDITVASLLAQFLSSPNASKLEELQLGGSLYHGTRIDDEVVPAICGLKNLKVLDLCGTRISDQGIRQIFESEARRNLIKIDLPEAVSPAPLVGNVLRPNLEVIRNDGNFNPGPNIESLGNLAAAKNLPGLRIVDVYMQMQGAEKEEIVTKHRLPLAASPDLPALMRILSYGETVFNIDTFRRVNAEAIENYRAEHQGRGGR